MRQQNHLQSNISMSATARSIAVAGINLQQRSHAGRARPKPYKNSLFPGISELQKVTEKCKTTLLQHGRPAKLKKLPDAVQVVVLTTIATLALKRPLFVDSCVTALVQAADSMKDIGVLHVIILNASWKKTACRTCWVRIGM